MNSAIPLLTPHLSSYWLYLVTKVNFSLASSLVESLKIESIVENHEIQFLLPHACMPYVEAIKQTISDRQKILRINFSKILDPL